MEIVNKIRDILFRVPRFPVMILEEYPNFDLGEIKRLKSLKNIHAGEKCFIVGNGPSLKNTDLRFLENEITFGFNGIYLNKFGFKPTYYMATDTRVFEQFDNDFYNFYKEKAFFPIKFKNKIPLISRNNKFFFNVNRGFHIVKSPNYKVPRFSNNPCKRVYEAPSVIFYCLQLAKFLGFDEINLVGVDFNYDKGSHFISGYINNCKNWNKPDEVDLINCLMLANKELKDVGISVNDLTIGGKLPLFNKISFDEYFSWK
ncbi:6-hydroxymethylpterin diphosphokinase MptE-like protein [Vibrio cholerae]|uniref:6-hydroxymethylpterin diphosphokinase MptE-like protein n=1 Tax=Vibrio cholerae TaxID=666 RepID=UPI00115BF537|nr:6-hydroxymethylpterin diphosphokinase MptE-like protein [Vibrio cholerae]TQP71398.1 DUF115 domain-containing protein [Vibrio cholerae]